MTLVTKEERVVRRPIGECVVCAHEDVPLTTIGVCGHAFCLECVTRMRTCPFCRGLTYRSPSSYPYSASSSPPTATLSTVSRIFLCFVAYPANIVGVVPYLNGDRRLAFMYLTSNGIFFLAPTMDMITSPLYNHFSWIRRRHRDLASLLYVCLMATLCRFAFPNDRLATCFAASLAGWVAGEHDVVGFTGIDLVDSIVSVFLVTLATYLATLNVFVGTTIFFFWKTFMGRSFVLREHLTLANIVFGAFKLATSFGDLALVYYFWHVMRKPGNVSVFAGLTSYVVSDFFRKNRDDFRIATTVAVATFSTVVCVAATTIFSPHHRT